MEKWWVKDHIKNSHILINKLAFFGSDVQTQFHENIVVFFVQSKDIWVRLIISCNDLNGNAISVLSTTDQFVRFLASKIVEVYFSTNNRQ